MIKKIRNTYIITGAFIVCTAAHAQSSVTIYGTVAEELQYASNSATRWGMVPDPYYGSKFGLKGTEDLGGGLKAVFQLEGGFDLSTGKSLQGTATSSFGSSATPSATGRLFGRTADVGLTNQYGTVTFGRQFTLADNLTNRMYPRVNPNTANYNLTAGHYIPWNDNMAKYVGQFGPVGVGASYTFTNNGSGRAYELGGSFTSGPVDIVGYYRQIDNADPQTVRRHIASIGGSFAVTESLSLFAGYLSRIDGGDPQRNNVWMFGARYLFSPTWSTAIDYVHDTQSGSASLDGRRNIMYADVTYAFSKATLVYAIVGHNIISGHYAVPDGILTSGVQTTVGLGIRHFF